MTQITSFRITFVLIIGIYEILQSSTLEKINVNKRNRYLKRFLRIRPQSLKYNFRYFP